VRAFTADAAHELRTPLTVARVRATEITDPVLRGALIADLDRLAGTVAHLLDIAQLDAITDLMTQPVDLSELAEKEIASIAPLAFRQGKTLELLRPQGVNIVSADPHLLASAVAALLENAVRHTRAGTHITVDTRNARAFSVVDDGEGIALSDQDLVFRRFWRRDRASTDSSGLGLSIVQRVTEVHGGTVTLSSSPGHTEFTVRLPGWRPTGAATRLALPTDVGTVDGRCR
jgi:signal transduction histidine kinase